MRNKAKTLLLAIKENTETERHLPGKVRIAVLTVILTAMSSPLYALAAPNLEKTANNIHSTAKTWVKPVLIVVVIVIGFLLVLGGQRGSEKAKTMIPAVIAGVLLVVMAISFSDQFIEWVAS